MTIITKTFKNTDTQCSLNFTKHDLKIIRFATAIDVKYFQLYITMSVVKTLYFVLNVEMTVTLNYWSALSGIDDFPKILFSVENLNFVLKIRTPGVEKFINQSK